MNYVGQLYGFQVFEDDNVLTLKYPTGKKDGNKLGKRKRNLLAPDIKFSKSRGIIIHPDLRENFINFINILTRGNNQ